MSFNKTIRLPRALNPKPKPLRLPNQHAHLFRRAWWLGAAGAGAVRAALPPGSSAGAATALPAVAVVCAVTCTCTSKQLNIQRPRDTSHEQGGRLMGTYHEVWPHCNSGCGNSAMGA